ncbi:CBS domain-containing protein [Azospirillum rugosum]|uniref:CBS domain-containing protein n=1 Tax=Azospirillum rugosum TaxID=416170 RepID=A0ABS4SD73_9PROT|nr:CBS domain-containing protein [Azospirillum rugosum]MBP2290442.1 CBS domain-containing protein [Azospirillum rugosum]MDQ0527918.1 CBS domain-containing protein [Azospirillum rugosum]
MQIREIMTRQVELVNPDTPLQDAARMMRDANIGFLPVGENDRLVGTLTDRDIAVRAVAEGKDVKTAKVADAMTPDLAFAFDDQDSSEAAQIMAEKQIRRLPILNRDKRLVGVVALGDLATKTGDDDVVGQTVQDVSEPTKGKR